MCKIIAISNQKGGVGKTTTCINLGIGLAGQGKRVLLIDADAQGNLTTALGNDEADEIEHTLAGLMEQAVENEAPDFEETILSHEEGVDYIPGNIELAGLETKLVNVMSRETVMKTITDELREKYDYILIDCMPSLGIITVNAMTCADSVLIPVQAHYLSVKGLQQLFRTIGKVRRTVNKELKIEGVLLTFVQRTKYNADIVGLVNEVYGGDINVFTHTIPTSIRAAETSVEGKSIFKHDKNGKVAEAYSRLVLEVLEHEGK